MKRCSIYILFNYSLHCVAYLEFIENNIFKFLLLVAICENWP